MEAFVVGSRRRRGRRTRADEVQRAPRRRAQRRPARRLRGVLPVRAALFHREQGPQRRRCAAARRRMGLKLNEYALIREADGRCHRLRRRGGDLPALGLPSSRPSCARTRARSRPPSAERLPRLIARDDLKGSCTATRPGRTGRTRSRRWREAARAMGMTYLGLCDHSRAAAYAGGMSIERVKEQHREIDAVNAKLGGSFRVSEGDRGRHPRRRLARFPRRGP